MKLLVILSTIFMATTTYAAQTCDLNVSVSKLKDAKVTTFLLENQMSNPYQQVDYVSDLLKAKLLKKCSDESAIDCQITNTNLNYDDSAEAYIISATVQGKIVKGGKKLSDSEYAKERQKAICEKVDTCINDALNDEETSTNFMEKLYMVKDKNNCNQIESFLFSK